MLNVVSYKVVIEGERIVSQKKLALVIISLLIIVGVIIGVALILSTNTEKDTENIISDDTFKEANADVSHKEENAEITQPVNDNANDVVSETSKQNNKEEESANQNLEKPRLTADMSIGVDVILDYADENIVVFHGYFGLFVYDLNAEKITFAADLEKTVGTNGIQGSEGAAVRVSEDGNTIQLYSYTEQGDSEMAYIIDAKTGKYSYDKNVPISPSFTPTSDMLYRFSGMTLGELTYNDNDKSWLIFKDWEWAS